MRRTAIAMIFISVIGLSCQNDDWSFAPADSQKHQPTDQEWNRIQKLTEITHMPGVFSNHTDTIKPDFSSLARQVSLKRRPAGALNFKQVERKKIIESFQQGSAGERAVEEFQVRLSGYLDVLIVMDNSGTMKEFQNGVATRLTNLLSALGDVDWKIAVTTTSSYDQYCLRSTTSGLSSITRQEYLDNPEEAIAAYKELVMAGTDGDVVERGIKAATLAAIGECGDPDRDWKRPESHLAVLIVSDEKHCGSAPEEGCAGQPWDSKEFFIDNSPRPPEKTGVFGLFLLKKISGLEEDPLCPGSGGYDNEFPTEYIDLVESTGGIYGEICQEDYSSVLNEISKNVADRIRNEFHLQFSPIPGTLEVTFAGKPVPFQQSGKTIFINSPLADGSLEITYMHSPGVIKDQFILGQHIDPNSLKIKLNNKIIDSNRFRLLENNAIVEFLSPPPPSSHISLEYLPPLKLDQTFIFAPQKDVKSWNLFVNGHESLDYVLDWEQGLLAFHSPPNEGAKIELKYERNGDVTTNYMPESIPWQRIKSLSAEEASSGNPVPVSLETDYISFPEGEVFEGRQVNLSFELFHTGADLEFSIPLPHNLWEQPSLELDSEQAKCEQTINASHQLIVTCDSDNFDQILVKYRTLDDINLSFQVGEEKTPYRDMHVFIDGVKTNAFVWEGERVLLTDKNINPDSIVTVRITPNVSSR